MLADGLKISWRHFRSGYIHNLAILFLLIISNAALLTIFMLKDNQNLKIMLSITASIGYAITIIIATYATKFRVKEIVIRKMLGARFKQILMLTFFDSLIYMSISAIFSIIIVEHLYEHNEIFSILSLLLVLKYLSVLGVLSLIISIFPALKLNTISPNKL